MPCANFYGEGIWQTFCMGLRVDPLIPNTCQQCAAIQRSLSSRQRPLFALEQAGTIPLMYIEQRMNTGNDVFVFYLLFPHNDNWTWAFMTQKESADIGKSAGARPRYRANNDPYLVKGKKEGRLILIYFSMGTVRAGPELGRSCVRCLCVSH